MHRMADTVNPQWSLVKVRPYSNETVEAVLEECRGSHTRVI